MASQVTAIGGCVYTSGAGMRGEEQFLRDMYDKTQHQNGR